MKAPCQTSSQIVDEPTQTTAGTVKHTSGPWFVFPVDHPTVTRENCISVLYVGTAADKPSIVRLTESGHAHATDEDRANARLIASAPELLNALEILLQMCERQSDFNDDRDGNTLATARAAIAKATLS